MTLEELAKWCEQEAEFRRELAQGVSPKSRSKSVQNLRDQIRSIHRSDAMKHLACAAALRELALRRDGWIESTDRMIEAVEATDDALEKCK